MESLNDDGIVNGLIRGVAAFFLVLFLAFFFSEPFWPFRSDPKLPPDQCLLNPKTTS